MILSEHQEAVELANRLRYNKYKFHHSPNETYTKSWSQKRKNTLEWVSAWFPDYCILLKKKKALLFIELKRARDYSKSKNWKAMWKASKEQLDWLLEFNKIQNVGWYIAEWALEAIRIINKIEEF